MALIPDPSRNFIHALSAFWTSYFSDVDEQQAYYEGVQLNAAQLYLEMLQTILGTSLKDIPLFSRWYFKHLTLRQDRLFFMEGPSTAEDVYVFAPTEGSLIEAEAITNRVIAPTAILQPLRDYTIESGQVRFARNLFNTDGANTYEPYFAVRSQAVVEPSMFQDPLGTDWVAAGVKPGDVLRVQLHGTAPRYVRIVAVNGSMLFLEQELPETLQELSLRTVQYDVLRVPYDQTKVGMLLSANTSLATTLGNASVVPGTMDLDVSSASWYRGAWGTGTSYAAGDVVLDAGALYRAKLAHTSGVSLGSQWDAITGSYINVMDTGQVVNNGMYLCTATSAGTITLGRPVNFSTSTSPALLTIVAYTGAVTTTGPLLQPGALVTQTFLLNGTLSVVAQRAHDVLLNGAIFPAGENVVEGVDYVVDYDAGLISFLTGWRAGLPARASYQWLRRITGLTRTAATVWAPSTPHAVGDQISYNGVVYICCTADPGGVSFDATKYVLNKAFTSNVSVTVPTMSLWASNVLLDEDALYNNFGYLLDFQKPTSEQYRALLRGVAQLFILGPTLERFEAAMNTMAGFPVVRDDNELLLGYSDGITTTGTDGQLLDTQEGREGLLTSGASTFEADVADFFPTDVGAVLSIQDGAGYDTYLVTAFIDTHTVQIAPTPPDAGPVSWSMQHVALTTRFRTASYAFTDADLNGRIIISGSNNARNNGLFRIVAVDNPSTVVLETPYGFTDETGLTWKLSHSNQQTVTTNRATYAFPLQVAMRADIVASASWSTLRLRAFEALTQAFTVVDYVRDPTWWHNTMIPQEVLTQVIDTAGRRKVSPVLVEHVYGAADNPIYGDFGLAYGVDDEGRAGFDRTTSAQWFGGTAIVLPSNTIASIRDVGQYVICSTPGFKGYFQITALSDNKLTVTLDRFPPPEARLQVPPLSLTVQLPPLLYRRSVAFVMMDRFLKYHAVQIKIDKNTPLPSDFIVDAIRLITEAKPSHTFIYLESLTAFTDKVTLTESLGIDLGVPLVEPIVAVDTLLRYGVGASRYGDAFTFGNLSTSISGVGTHTLPITLPAGDAQATLVKVRFDPATMVGSRIVAEDVDYTVDYSNHTVTLGAGFPVGSHTVYYVAAIRRYRSDVDTLATGETRLVYGGADPTLYRAAGQLPSTMGIIDRAVSITLGP